MLATAAPGAAWAQEVSPAATQPPAQESPVEDDPMMDEVYGEEIVVTGSRPRGSVVGDIPPEQTLNPADIRAYGVNSIDELLTELGPQLGSGRGRGGEAPVVLLSGRRISGFREIRSIPTEAIERVEILPEEVALSYGYPATQRVVNIVLRERFRAITAELEGTVPTAGGTSDLEAEANILRLTPDGRSTFEIEATRQSLLLESERDIIRDDAETGDPRFRSLRGESEGIELDGTIARTLFGDVATSFNVGVDANDSRSLLGLPELSPDATDPLTRTTSTRNLTLNASANGDVADWRWTLTGNYDRNQTNTQTDRTLDAAGPRSYDTARSINNVGRIEGILNGDIVALPAGDISTTIKLGGRTTQLDGVSLRRGTIQETGLGRDSANGQISIDVPIADRGREVLAPIGDLSFNANAAIDQLSDFGTLTTLGYGLNWSPITEIRFIVSATHEEGAPSTGQVGDPVIATPNVRVFDFLTGETVEITRIDGGSANLLADSRTVWKLGMNARPFADIDLNLRADYINEAIDNPIASFPTATAEIEAAFPERFVRDGNGRLVSIDNRPVNFLKSERQELRWGFNLSLPIKGTLQKRAEDVREAGGDPRSVLREAFGRPDRAARRAARANQPGALPAEGAATPEGQAAAAPAPQPGGARRFGGGRRGGGGGRFGGGGNGGGRFQFSAFHTWRLQETIQIREGLPELDLLGGSATGSRGGQPRHQVQVRTGITKDGFGLRLNGDWQSATQVDAGPGGSGEALFFSDQTTFDLRLFANLGAMPSLVRNHRWLRGTRVTLRADNLFDTRLRVTDASGATPLGYQADLLDPIGRTVRLELRKLF
ncbi:hypothetical protein GCM10009106_00550 [Sphingomonas japonica]